DQQATGGPTSLEVTSKGRANPQLSSADSGLSTPKDSISNTTGKGASDIPKRLRNSSTLPLISSALKIYKRRSIWRLIHAGSGCGGLCVGNLSFKKLDD
ncbi:hypothetical protein Tco_0137086, partial [Tanacetum coccineum]